METPPNLIHFAFDNSTKVVTKCWTSDSSLFDRSLHESKPVRSSHSYAWPTHPKGETTFVGSSLDKSFCLGIAPHSQLEFNWCCDSNWHIVVLFQGEDKWLMKSEQKTMPGLNAKIWKQLRQCFNKSAAETRYVYVRRTKHVCAN